MSEIEKRLADICEGYFQDLERQAYRPEGCSGDELAKVLVAELGPPDPRPGLLAAADVLDGYPTKHPDSPGGKDIYHLLQELRYMADNADEDES